MTVEIQTLTHFGHGKKERVARNISIDMEPMKFLPLLIICVQTAKGFTWKPSTTSNSVCVGNTISLDWDFTTDSGEISLGISWTKYDGAGGSVSLGNDLGGLSTAPAYVGRLTNIGKAGIAISNATSSDIGTYTVDVALTSGDIYRMNTTVHVHEIANASCIPTCDTSLKCQIPQACPVQNYIDAVWTVDGVKYPNEFKCSSNNYNKPYNVCAEGDAVTLCYRGPSLCREEKPCIGTKCQLELGLALGLGLGIPCVITIIDVGIIIYTSCKYAYILGLVLDVGLGVTFQVGWIIIVSLISKGSECKLELGLGLGLSSGMLYVISGIVSVIFMFFVFFLCKGIPNRVELGKGILTGFLLASVIGIILVYLKYDKLKREPTCTKHEDNPPKPDDHKSKTKNSGHPTSHLGKNNKVDPNTNSKQANDRQQPVPPVNTAFEDTRTFHPLPQRPQNGEIKDQNLRGRSATTDDTPGLANETSRNNILPPLTLEPKKKRKKNKKKDQRNEKTPEDENSETIMIVD